MKRISSKINDFITYLAFVIENSISIVSEDKLLLVFFVISYIPNLIIKITSGMGIFNLKSFLFNLAWFCFFAALSYNFKKFSSRVVYFCIVTFINYVLTYSNIMYHRFYDQSFLSISLLKQITVFKDVADATQVGMTFFDVFYWLLLIISLGLIIAVASSRKFRFRYYDVETKLFNRFTFFRMALISFIVPILFLQPSNYSQVTKMWNRPIVVEHFGLYNYHVADIIQSAGMLYDPKPSESDYEKFINYFNDKDKEYEENDYFGIFENKNVIVIHAESVENFLINREYNGTEITPVLNNLANTGFYFSNTYSQESVGTSSDTEFTFNTSLLPAESGTIFLNYFDKTYSNAIPNILKDEGYNTISMHANNGSFWNRNVMHPVLGYDMFIDKELFHFTDDQVIGLGLSDKDFFLQSIDFLEVASEPYYSTLITLTNHTPWSDVDNYITFNDNGEQAEQIDCGDELEGKTLCRYLKSVHYSDWALGEFIKGLEARKMLDDTVIVIYGDHPANIPLTDMEIIYGKEIDRIEYKARQQIPFIIWNNDIKEPVKIDEVMGMYDAKPTLLNMLGLKDKFTLGHDMFSTDDNLVVFTNGDWVDRTIYYDSFRNNYYLKDLSYDESLIDEDYIDSKSKKAHEIVDMSNLINRFDMLKEYLENNKKE